MDWVAVSVIVAAIAGQTIWIARALASLRRRLDRLDAHLDRLDARHRPSIDC